MPKWWVGKDNHFKIFFTLITSKVKILFMFISHLDPSSMNYFVISFDKFFFQFMACLLLLLLKFYIYLLFIYLLWMGSMFTSQKSRKYKKAHSEKFLSHSCSFIQFLSPEALWLHFLRTLFIMLFVEQTFKILM